MQARSLSRSRPLALASILGIFALCSLSWAQASSTPGPLSSDRFLVRETRRALDETQDLSSSKALRLLRRRLDRILRRAPDSAPGLRAALELGIHLSQVPSSTAASLKALRTLLRRVRPRGRGLVGPPRLVFATLVRGLKLAALLAPQGSHSPLELWQVGFEFLSQEEAVLPDPLTRVALDSLAQVLRERSDLSPGLARLLARGVSPWVGAQLEGPAAYLAVARALAPGSFPAKIELLFLRSLLEPIPHRPEFDANFRQELEEALSRSLRLSPEEARTLLLSLRHSPRPPKP